MSKQFESKFMNCRNYVIVGGSKGIGLGLVQKLATDGNQITVLSRSPDSVANLPNVTHLVFDASQDDVPVQQLPATIHGLAYCPGSLNLRAFKSLMPEIFRADFELNVIGAVRALQAIMPALKSAAQESLLPSSTLLFSTVAASQGMYAHASIAASKGAIESLTRTVAAELSPEIRVNCIAPALTQTALTEKFFADPERVAALGERYPLGRTGTVDDIANLGVFLLGTSSTWITGQVFGVDGGMSTVRK